MWMGLGAKEMSPMQEIQNVLCFASLALSVHTLHSPPHADSVSLLPNLCERIWQLVFPIEETQVSKGASCSGQDWNGSGPMEPAEMWLLGAISATTQDEDLFLGQWGAEVGCQPLLEAILRAYTFIVKGIGENSCMKPFAHSCLACPSF